MNSFRYTGTRTLDGTRIQGQVIAASAKEAREDILRLGINPIDIKRDYANLFTGVGRPLSTRDLVLFARTTATMMDAGVPLPTVYRSLLDAEISPNLHYVIKRMLVQLESGQSAAEAMRAHAGQFPPMFPTLVGIGEDTGHMDQTFARIAMLTERTQAVRNRVRKAMVYPMTITAFAVLAIGALLVFVLPKFVAIFTESGVELPWATQTLMNASTFLTTSWIPLLVGLFVLITVGRRVLVLPAVRGVWDRYSVRAPLLGNVAIKGQSAQFARALETLIRSGIDLISALELASQAFTNRHLRNIILDARRQVLGGATLVEPLRAAKIFPSMVITMLRVGEEVGEIDQMLSKIADIYEDEVERAVDSAIELINPIMLIVFGGMVMMIMASIYLPMIDMISAIS